MSSTSQDVFPLLVADLANAEDFGILHACAEARQVVAVPLIAGPVDRRRHLLEAYAPGVDAPVRFLAEPVGGPTEQGFPLRLEPYADPSQQSTTREKAPSTAMRSGAVLRPRQATSPHLTRGQTYDLEAPASSTAPAADAHVGRLLAGGKYLLDESIGVGGMGEVYRAHHRDLDKHVAVKMLHPSLLADPTFARRFKAEALTMSRIDHPAIARVLDFGQESDGTLYLVMEYLEGKSLEAVFQSEGPLALERLVRIMMQVAAALAHVHRHGIIHRDVKPSNILLVAGQDDDEQMPTEMAKVCDFGIALARGDGGGAAAGTPEYMSPEQCRGADLDERSDLYSVGVMLYELSTGRLPFEGDGASVMRQHLTDTPAPPSTIVPDLDPLFEQIVMKALEKEPSARQASMRQLRTELRELLAPVVLDAGPPSMDMSMAPAPPPAAAPAEGGGESWLEGRDAGMSAFFTTLADTVDHMKIYHESDETANQLAADPTPWLMEMAGIIDAAKFGERAEILARAVRALLKKGEVVALSAVVTTMRRVLREEAATGRSERMNAAGNVLRVMRDPLALGTLVDIALGAVEEPSRELVHVLVETQAAGASALLAGRMERHATPVARQRFALLVAQIGVASMPVLRDALMASLASGERSGALVEDVQRAIPPVPDETTGKVVAELLRGGSPVVMAHALVALTSLWGDRARPLLHGALGNPDDTVRMGALHGLRRLRAIDLVVVRQLSPLLLSTRSDDLRVAMIATLVEAQPEAKSEASAGLVRAFARSASFSGTVVLGLAQALVAVGAPNAAGMIRERAETSQEPLRSHLLATLGR